MYLIDGNNLMGAQTSRRHLLRDLARFAKSKQARVTVVFDGAPDDHFPENSSYQTVKIFYARRNSDADTRIKEFIEKSSEKRQTTVVTSDRALIGYVRQYGAKTLSSADFRRKLDETDLPLAEQDFDQSVKPDEMSQWLRYFGADETD